MVIGAIEYALGEGVWRVGVFAVGDGVYGSTRLGRCWELGLRDRMLTQDLDWLTQCL